ncbi:hypothetical protein BGZ60DRAFT_406807 [Tricladium varicosporioides]|nr:hypothetical protein BGZ60DRAFT_406807 [Hymenoscyphus varicosporioides]
MLFFLHSHDRVSRCSLWCLRLLLFLRFAHCARYCRSRSRIRFSDSNIVEFLRPANLAFKSCSAIDSGCPCPCSWK